VGIMWPETKTGRTAFKKKCWTDPTVGD